MTNSMSEPQQTGSTPPNSKPRTHLGLRGRLAIGAGRFVAFASRTLGRGAGGMIGGRIALKIDPNILSKLAAGREIVVVTGTNGKSTTNRMVCEGLQTLGQVASNSLGDNMPEGIVSALMTGIGLKAKYCALEVDEMHVPAVSRQVRPKVMVLLNLSRDQLDRVGEIGSVEKRLRQAVNENPEAVIVANCDDPLIVSAAWDAPHVIWVAAGGGWGEDSASFPRGGGSVVREGDRWWVPGTEFSRPDPTWWVDWEQAVLKNLSGDEYTLELSVPGRANQCNAAQAVAATLALGVLPSAAVEAACRVRSVAGRYATYWVQEREVRLLLAKNPAGWQEALHMIPQDANQVVVVVNGQVPDGMDLSWLWDVGFERLAELELETLLASGERAADLAVRLEYAQAQCQTIPDSLQAVLACSPGRVEVLANYTAFRDLKKKLHAAGYIQNDSERR